MLQLNQTIKKNRASSIEEAGINRLYFLSKQQVPIAEPRDDNIEIERVLNGESSDFKNRRDLGLGEDYESLVSLQILPM